jgi:sugar phosphate isomerase/epimerase
MLLNVAGALGATPLLRVPRAPRRPRLKHLGVQAGILRAALTRDLAGTLERVAAIGYSMIELQWYGGNFGQSPAALRAALDRASLRAASTLVHPGAILVGWARHLAAASDIGIEYVSVVNRLFHLKDIPRDSESGDRPLGEGRVDFQRILAAIPARDDRLFFVEHALDPRAPFDALGRSYDHLARLEL